MNLYDELPYQGGSFRHTHPDHIGTLARLFGLEAPPAQSCRVLELGCAAGVNLRQMACSSPESEFVGIDGSQVQIQEGNEALEALGLQNLSLHHVDILELAKDEAVERWGRFDYILCHGVWSWVPEPVQEAIFIACKLLLQPTGVAYISYNTLPGWYQRLQVRDLMLFHAKTFEGTKDQIDQARAILGFLAKGSSYGESIYRTLNQHWNDQLKNYWNEYLFHEYLAPVNKPVYFKDFMAAATQHELQYLGEAEFSTMLPAGLPEEVQADLERVSTDLLRGEQYMDFLRNRTFRRTLLVHKDREPERNLNWESLAGLRLSALFEAKDVGVLEDSSTATFHRMLDEAPLSIDVPIVKAALVELADIAPRSMGMQEIIDRSRARIGSTATRDADAEDIGTNLLASASRDFVEISTAPRCFTSVISERPRATIVTLKDVERDRYATTLLFQQVALEPFERHLLMLCDGSRTVAELATKMTAKLDEGILEVDFHGPTLAGNAALEQVMESLVGARLKKLARLALLVG